MTKKSNKKIIKKSIKNQSNKKSIKNTTKNSSNKKSIKKPINTNSIKKPINTNSIKKPINNKKSIKKPINKKSIKKPININGGALTDLVCNSDDYISLDENVAICLKKLNEYINLPNLKRSDDSSCIIVNNKKTEYYIHTYDPAPIIETIAEQGVYNMDYIQTVFNTNKYENCCNCISIVLYSTESDDCFNLFRYLTNILGTLNNVKKYLNNYIVRLYLDKSVLECIFNTIEKYRAELETPIKIPQTLKTNPAFLSELNDHTVTYKQYSILLSRVMNYIIENPICEIHMNFCTRDKQLNLSKSRIYRYNGFIDTDVNINISREADGILTTMDCYNIKI